MPRRKAASAGAAPAEPAPVNIVARLPRDPGQLATRVEASWAAIKLDTAHFPSPVPGPSVIDGAVTGIRSAVKAAEGGGAAEMAALRKAAKQVRSVWRQLTPYVQTQLRAIPPEDVPGVLVTILFFLSRVGVRAPKPPIAAKDGPTSGSAKVAALAIARALTYVWEWSVDQANWSSATSGKSKAIITGLTPGKTYYLRVRAFLRDETMSAYSPTITFMPR